MSRNAQIETLELGLLVRGDTLQSWSVRYDYVETDDLGEPILDADDQLQILEPLDIVAARVRLTNALGLETFVWSSPERVSLDAPGEVTFTAVADTSSWLEGPHTGDVTLTLASGETLTRLKVSIDVLEAD